MGTDPGRRIDGLDGVVVGGELAAEIAVRAAGAGDGVGGAQVPAMGPDGILAEIATPRLFADAGVEDHQVVDEAVRLVPVAVAIEIVTILLIKLGQIDGRICRHLRQRLLHQLPYRRFVLVAAVVGRVLPGCVPTRHLTAHAVALAGLLLVELAHGDEAFTVRTGIAFGREQQIVVVRLAVVRVVHLGELGGNAVLRVVGEVHQDGEDLVLAHLAPVMLLLDGLEQQGGHPIAGAGGAVQADLLEDALPYLALFHRQGATVAVVGP